MQKLQPKPDPKNLPMVEQSLDISCGAACFASMFELIFGKNLGELYFADRLKTIERGMTHPENIVQLAKDYGLEVVLKRGCNESDLQSAVDAQQIVFVTWWFDDAGHYSLIRSVDKNEIVLMDPWQARIGQDTKMKLTEFSELWEKRGSLMITV